MKISKIFVIGVALFSVACNNDTKSPDIDKISIPVENVKPTKDQADRRKASEAYCKSHNIPIYSNPNSMFSAPEAEVSLRSKEDVIDRALVLMYLGVKSEGATQEILNKIDKLYDISSKLTAKEKEYVNAKQPTDQQRTDANWRYESVHVMLWALGYINDLSYPDAMCNVSADVKIIHDLTPEQFRTNARLRSRKEILDQADLILRLNWACVNARLQNESAPGNLNADVVSERHYTLNWLIKYMNQNWDDVSTDT